ncbi:MAG: fimbrial biogenesis chaperone [Thermoanaerobaculia bacterium]
MKRSNLLLPFVLGLALSQAEPSFAANFRVSPIQVHLGGSGRSALVTLFNEADRPVRFQITAVTWNQTPEGEMDLAPTEDIVFFPKLLELGAGEQRNVRIAAQVDAGEVEKTYRLFFEEMPPPPTRDGEGARVEVLTKMGVPIFVAPAGADADPAIGGFALEEGTLAFQVENRGGAHFTLHSVAVRGVNAEGAEVFSKRREGWYVLARSERDYTLELDERECGDTARIEIEATISLPQESSTESIRADWPMPDEGCR